MITVGIDHGTSGIVVCIKENKNYTIFKLKRTELLKKSFLEELKNYVSLGDIDLIALTYSMGDGINKILPIERVKNRGVLSIEGAGKKIGGGTKVYDEIKNSNIPTIVIPGLHRGIECLDRRFRALYSHISSPEKIGIAYYAHKKFNLNDFVLSDISSNTVTLLIKDKKFFGGFDACIGAIGILHGPIDLELIRKIDNKEITANEAFSTAGAVKIAKRYLGVENTKEEILKNYHKDENCKLAIDSLILSVAMEINSLLPLLDKKIVVLAGSVGVYRDNINIPNEIKKFVNGEIYILDGESAAIGLSLIAEDILKGERNILGIPVEV
ncbi:methanogenesis marker 12 protein [Methanocaldococcus indicus]|uniref:methanogenesis marker 12 protein n=1 Tax=Methanocaldococcus indicus TaxID=213231 RepID=UPI003C6CF918